MDVVKKKLSELHEAEVNTRYHSERQISEYVRSLKMFGQTKPIVADENGEVIIGNGLLMALRQMGAEEADCYIVKGLTAKQKKKMMLADNKIFEMGMSLDYVMHDLVKEMHDMDIPGFSPDILNSIIESTAETTRAIESYGSYPDESLSGIHRAQNDEERPPLYTEARTFQNTANAPETPSTASEEHPAESVETERFVTCPHCGQRFRI